MKRKEAKGYIRSFMQQHYTDERLCALLAHARDGKLSFVSCCCFVGASTADHAMAGYGGNRLPGRSGYPYLQEPHYLAATKLEGYMFAESAFFNLCVDPGPAGDVVRRRILIPVIRAEMKRREVVRDRFEFKKQLVEYKASQYTGQMIEGLCEAVERIQG